MMHVFCFTYLFIVYNSQSIFKFKTMYTILHNTSYTFIFLQNTIYKESNEIEFPLAAVLIVYIHNNDMNKFLFKNNFDIGTYVYLFTSQFG